MRLRDVADVNPPVRGLGQGDVGKISFLSLDRIWADERFDASDTVIFTGDVKSYNPVADGDILVPKVTPTFSHGRVAIASGLVNGLALATSEVFVVRARDPRDTSFLRYRLLARDFRAEGEANQFGVAGLKRISGEFLRNVRIDESAWDRRHEIAGFLHFETARMRRLSVANTTLLAGLRTAWDSRLAEVVEETKGHMKPLHVCVQPERPIMYGIVLPGPPAQEGVLLVKGGNVERGALRPQDLVRTTAEIESRFARARLNGGDLLMTIRGSYGAVAEVPAEIEGANITQDTARIAPGDGVDGRWLLYMLRSPWCQQQLAVVATGAGVKGVNIKDLKRLRVPMPPLGTQRSFAAELDDDASAVSQLRARVEGFGEKLEEYRDALITEAVNGELSELPSHERRVATVA